MRCSFVRAREQISPDIMVLAHSVKGMAERLPKVKVGVKASPLRSSEIVGSWHSTAQQKAWQTYASSSSAPPESTRQTTTDCHSLRWTTGLRNTRKEQPSPVMATPTNGSSRG
jgi:hypothetical protein